MTTLTGKTILNCRPEEDSAALSRLISAHHGHPIECPLIRRLSLLSGDHGDDLILLLEKVGPGAVVAFTSPHGVRVTVEYLQERGESLLLEPMKIAVVGEGTRAEALRLGLLVALTADDAHGEGLARKIIEVFSAEGGTLPPVVLARNESGDKNAVQLLRAAHFDVSDFHIYRGEGIEPSRFFEIVIRFVERGGRFDFVVLSSAEGARQYSKLLSRFSEKSAKAVAHLREVPVIAFAQKTSVVVRELGLVLGGVAEKPTNENVVRAAELSVLAHRSTL